MVSRAFLASVVGVLALLAGLGVYEVGVAQPGNTTPAGSGTCPGTCTTLEAIIAGQFQSSTDKSGTGGTTVTVRGLEVLYVQGESDGDWHVGVTDGKVPMFVTEIIPRDQAHVGRPTEGSTIDETGTPFCDTYHENESWHGDTCWEIHPITAWQTSSESVALTTSTTSSSFVGLNVKIQPAQNPVVRGSQQTINFTVSDSDGPLRALVYVVVTYVTGYTRDFSCTTLADGTCSVSWVIGSNSDPGTFTVTATVEGQQFGSSFEVTA